LRNNFKLRQNPRQYPLDSSVESSIRQRVGFWLRLGAVPSSADADNDGSGLSCNDGRSQEPAGETLAGPARSEISAAHCGLQEVTNAGVAGTFSVMMPSSMQRGGGRIHRS
jgi:hypothetical protein